MPGRGTAAVLLAACAIEALLASSAAAWGLSGKPSHSTEGIHISPTSAGSTPKPVLDHYWWNVKTGAVQWEDPSQVHRTDDGNEYYTDPISGESTWTKPADLSWVEAHSEEHDREYYHNTATQESVWEKPENLFWRKVPTSKLSAEL